MARLVFTRPSDDEWYPNDIDRMLRILEANGHTATRADVNDAWKARSERSCATWLSLGDDDEEVLADLMRILDEE